MAGSTYAFVRVYSIIGYLSRRVQVFFHLWLAVCIITWPNMKNMNGYLQVIFQVWYNDLWLADGRHVTSFSRFDWAAPYTPVPRGYIDPRQACRQVAGEWMEISFLNKYYYTSFLVILFLLWTINRIFNLIKRTITSLSWRDSLSCLFMYNFTVSKIK